MKTGYKLVDLTHPLEAATPSWDGKEAFKLSIEADYEEGQAGESFRAQKITCETGIGTHMDAPAHVIKGGRTIDELALEELVTDCIVIDVENEANEDYMIKPSVIEKFEKTHGKITERSFVIFYTGWSKLWNNRERYHNKHKFPSVHASTAEILLERNIAGLGIDTLSADIGHNGFPVHQAILGANKYLVENIANAKMLPAKGAQILILPIKIKDGTEAPIRLIALI